MDCDNHWSFTLVAWLLFTNVKLSQTTRFNADLKPGDGISNGPCSCTCAKDVKQIKNMADVTTVETIPLYLPNGFKDVDVWHADNGPYLSVTQSKPGDSNVIQKTTPVFFPKGFRFEFICNK